MDPRVDFFSEPDFKGKQLTSTAFGKYKFAYPDKKESFTQQELIGRTFYLIQVNNANGKEWALDNGGSNKQGGLFHLWEWSKDNINQIFTMLPNGVIKCMGNTMTMDVIGGNFKNGTRLHLYPQNNTDAQLWTYDSNTRMLKLKNRNFCLNLHNYEFKNGAILNIWEPNGHESQMWTVKLCEIKDGFTSNPNVESFVIDFRRPFFNLMQQREQFNTCMANLFQHGDAGGESTGWVGIGDYSYDNYFKGGYSTQFANIGDFRQWVGKKFYIRCKQNRNFALDTRGFQANGRGDDSGFIGIWTFDPNQVNQIWTINAYGNLGPANNRRYILGAPAGSHQGSWPKMVDNQNGQNSGQRWRLLNGSICHLGGKPFLHVAGAVMKNGTRVGHWMDEGARRQLNCTWEIQECGYFGNEANGSAKNDDISTVVLKPYTDVFLYEHGFQGRVLHIHNGKDSDYRVNIYQNNLNFNDITSSYKVRAGAIDNKQYTDNNDTSGNAVCTLKFQTHFSNIGWGPISDSGAKIDHPGQRLEAIKFWYTGPGQMYARCRPAGQGWQDWVTSGDVCGTTGQGRKLDELEFKIDGASNIVFGCQTRGPGNNNQSHTWTEPMAWKVPSPGAAFEMFSLSVSLKGVQAVSPKTGRVINLVEIPKEWVITDLSIGKFEPLVGKPFFLRTRAGNKNFVIDTEGHQNGGGPIKIYEKVKDFHENQTWTVDKEGHLISWQNRNSILYIDNSRNEYRPTIIGWKGNEAKADSTKTKWRLTNEGCIVPLYQPNQVLDIAGWKVANNTPVILWQKHAGANQQWDAVEIQDMDIGGLKQWVGKPFYIKSRGNGNFVIDTEGHQNGGGVIKIYTKVEDMHPNQTWTTDAEGHLISWENRNSILYNNSTNNGSRPTIIGWKGNEEKAKSASAKWRLVDGQLQCLASVNQVIDISGGKYANNTPLILWGKHGGANQKWDFVQVEERPKVDKDIGAFKQWVGKSFVINVKSNPKMIIDTEGNHKADAKNKFAKLYEKVEDLHPNQTWTVDQDGHLISWDNRDAILYCSKYADGAEVEFVSAKAKGGDDQSKWRLMPNGNIQNIYDSRFTLQTVNANQQTRVVISKSAGLKEWLITEIIPCKWKGTPTIGSIIVGQLCDVIIYGVDTNCKEKSKKITIHNGMRWRPGKDPNVINYRIGDFYKKFGISGVKSYELKDASIDNTQNEKVEDWDDSKEPFTIMDNGKPTTIGIVLIVLAVIILAFAGVYCVMKFGGKSIAGFSVPAGGWMPVKQ